MVNLYTPPCVCGHALDRHIHRFLWWRWERCPHCNCRTLQPDLKGFTPPSGSLRPKPATLPDTVTPAVQYYGAGGWPPTIERPPMKTPDHWAPKWLAEALWSQQAYAPDSLTREAIEYLSDLLELHRPTGPNGKHGDLHTPTCGCEDK